MKGAEVFESACVPYRSLSSAVSRRQLAAADCFFLSPLMKPDTNVIAARGRTSGLMLWTAAGH